jgi:hypothetical protein
MRKNKLLQCKHALLILLLLSGCTKNSSTTVFMPPTNADTSALKTTKSGSAELVQLNNERGNSLLLAQGKYPDASSVDYYNVEETLDENGSKKLHVSAKTLNIKENSAQDFFKNNAKVSEVIIDAEKVMISTAMSFPGAQITINARELEFSDKGQIITTPASFFTLPDYGANGLKGLPAGNIILNVSSLDLGDKNIVRFILRGGQGQSAGAGRPGIDGKSINPIYGDVLRECTTNSSSCSTEDGPIENQTCRGSNEFPSNGQDALNGGAPGAGGDGGYLYSSVNINLKDSTDVASGAIGNVATLVSGGRAGQPTTSRFRNIFHSASCSSGGSRGHSSIRSIGLLSRDSQLDDVRVTTAGKNAIPSELPLEKSLSGEVRDLDMFEKVKPISDSQNLAMVQLDYAKDLYRNNYFIEAEKELKNAIITFSNNKSETLIQEIRASEARQFLLQLNSQKDFYGNELNLAPMISLEAMNEIYKQEINSSFETIAFVTKMKKTISKAEDKLLMLSHNKSLMENQIALLQDSYHSAYHKLPELETKLANTKQQQELLKDALDRVEQSINSQAEQNIEARNSKRNLLGAVKLIATLAKISPAGQPAASAIGNSISTIVSAAEDSKTSWQDQIKAGIDVYSNINTINWKKSKENWNNNFANLFMDKFSNSHPEIKGQELEVYLKNLYNVTKPLVTEVSKYYNDYINSEVPRSEYEAEVKRIKESSAIFKDALEKLGQVQKAKEETNSLLMHMSSTISYSQKEIVKDFIMISSTESESMEFSKGLNFSADQILSSMEKDARNRLIKYKAAFMNAYSYRTLEAYPGNLDLDKLDRQLEIFLTKTDEKEIQIDELKKVYQDDLRHVAESLFDLIQNGNAKEYETAFSKELNSGELEALNAGKTIYLDLTHEKEFRKTEANIRLISVELSDFSSETNDRGTLDLEVSLAGNSKLTKNNNEYTFVHENPTKSYCWKTRIDPTAGTAVLNKESSQNAGLLEIIMDKSTSNNALIFNRVGGRSVFAVKLNRDNSVAKLTYAKLNIKYSYSEQ